MMTRLAFLAALCGLAAHGEPAAAAPTDNDAMNAFAQQWNTYIQGLSAGRLDLKQWARVERAWKRLTQ